MTILAALIILMALVILISMVRFRNTPIVRSANEWFMYVHIVGVMLGVASVFPMAIRPSDSSCVLTMILSGIGFAIAVGVLLAKMIRIARILSNTTLVAVPISSKVWHLCNCNCRLKRCLSAS